jgi:hypothetical protein
LQAFKGCSGIDTAFDISRAVRRRDEQLAKLSSRVYKGIAIILPQQLADSLKPYQEINSSMYQDQKEA